MLNDYGFEGAQWDAAKQQAKTSLLGSLLAKAGLLTLSLWNRSLL